VLKTVLTLISQKTMPENPENNEPVRKLQKGRMGTHIVHFPSIKNGRSVVCESRMEADFLVILEFDPNIVSYRAQPERIELVVNGAVITYVPDFLSTDFKQQKKYWEIKSDSRRMDTSTMERLNAARDLLISRGDEYEIAWESEIRATPRLSVLQVLYRAAHTATPVSMDYLRETLSGFNGEATYGQLRKLEVPPSIAAIGRMALGGSLKVSMDQPFGLETILSLIGGQHE
jgi:hypothetical protein